MNKKIIFVEPRGAEANVFSKFMNLPLLGPVYLATILKSVGWDASIVNENILGRDLVESDLDCDFLGISILTNTAPRGYEIARMYRKANPAGTIIIGGIHASFMPAEALQYADYVVKGEGESAILDIVEGRVEKGVVCGKAPANLDEIPASDMSLLKNHEKIRYFPMMFSRGCPFDCNFCSVTEMFGRRYRFVTDDRALFELKNAPTDRIFIYDDNFAANPALTERLLDRIIGCGRKFQLRAQVRTDISKKPDIVKKMKDAGFSVVYVGIESINEDSLKSMNKRQSVDDIKRALDVFNRNDLSVHGMFIFGTDADKTGVFEETVKFCRKEGIYTAQFLALTPLPGTRLFSELESAGRLLHKEWQYYDGQHVVFRPKNMSVSELQQGILYSYKTFYSYISMADDVFKIAFESIYRLPETVSRQFGKVGNKLMARFIVNRWVKANKGYIARLKGI